MRGLIATFLGAAILLGCGPKPDSAGNNDKQGPPPISTIKPNPGLLGQGWVYVRGPTLDSWDDTKSIPQAQRPVAKQLRSGLEPMGVVSVGFFMWSHHQPPPDNVDVKVYIFETPRHCEKWIQKNILSEERKKQYSRLDKPYPAFDDVQGRMRIIAAGRHLITSVHIRDSDDHIRALEEIAGKLKLKL
jgi:hypothetical protein